MDPSGSLDDGIVGTPLRGAMDAPGVITMFCMVILLLYVACLARATEAGSAFWFAGIGGALVHDPGLGVGEFGGSFGFCVGYCPPGKFCAIVSFLAKRANKHPAGNFRYGFGNIRLWRAARGRWFGLSWWWRGP